ncbi:hypothetical protein D3C80_1254330 [compost metagenome]
MRHGLEARVRQTDEGVADGQGHGAGLRRHARQLGPRLVAGEGLDGLELDVVREDQGLVQVDVAQIGGRLERAQARALQPPGDVDGVALQEARQVHRHRAVGVDLDRLARPDDRGGEGGGDRVHLVGVGVHGAKAGVLEAGENAIADLVEGYDLRLAQARPVQPGAVQAQPRRQARLIEVAADHALGVRGGQARQHPALLPIQPHPEQAVLPGGGRGGRRPLRLNRDRRRAGGQNQAGDARQQNLAHHRPYSPGSFLAFARSEPCVSRLRASVIPGPVPGIHKLQRRRIRSKP